MGVNQANFFYSLLVTVAQDIVGGLSVVGRV